MQRVMWLGQLARILDDRWVKIVLMRGGGGKIRRRRLRKKVVRGNEKKILGR